ncbi:MAG TPA: UrcA family protein [Steroidobacteraceae bacterium]|jgi:UrcA family protein|nr:UrcA family protein [Steroidobacteraceae bacterium]
MISHIPLEDAMNTVKLVRRTSAWPVALGSLACLLGIAPVLAAAPVETRSVSVRYADLDLASAAGAAALYQRLQGAARVVCGYPDEMAMLSFVNRCNHSAIADAVSSVNAPLLRAVHNAHQGATVTATQSE